VCARSCIPKNVCEREREEKRERAREGERWVASLLEAPLHAFFSVALHPAREQFKAFHRLLHESQGQNLGLTVACGPSSPDFGTRGARTQSGGCCSHGGGALCAVGAF